MLQNGICVRVLASRVPVKSVRGMKTWWFNNLATKNIEENPFPKSFKRQNIWWPIYGYWSETFDWSQIQHPDHFFWTQISKKIQRKQSFTWETKNLKHIFWSEFWKNPGERTSHHYLFLGHLWGYMLPGQGLAKIPLGQAFKVIIACILWSISWGEDCKHTFGKLFR